MNIADAMERAKVFDYNLQEQLRPYMEHMRPRPSIYIPDFIAANQEDRADNVIRGTKKEMLDTIRRDIKEFKNNSGVDKASIARASYPIMRQSQQKSSAFSSAEMFMKPLCQTV